MQNHCIGIEHLTGVDVMIRPYNTFVGIFKSQVSEYHANCLLYIYIAFIQPFEVVIDIFTVSKWSWRIICNNDCFLFLLFQLLLNQSTPLPRKTGTHLYNTFFASIPDRFIALGFLFPRPAINRYAVPPRTVNNMNTHLATVLGRDLCAVKNFVEHTRGRVVIHHKA